MSENRSTSEGLLKSPKRFPTGIGEVPSYTLPSELGERNYDVRVLFYKSMIEITKAKEGLNVLNILRLWPFQDCLYFVGRHPESLWREDIVKIFHSIGMELTLVGAGVKAALSEYFLNMFAVFVFIVGVDQNIGEINDYRGVHHVGEDVIHKSLGSCGSVSKTKRHYQPLKGPVTSLESGLPLISICNSDKMVSMLEINLGVNLHFPRSIQKVS